MARFCCASFLLLICASTLLMDSTALASGDHHHQQLPWISTGAAAKSACKGSIAECLAAGDDDSEFDMDTEINRRILATTKYVSYGALQRNTVPCSRRGASYYNCQPGASSNPYSRSCSAVTRCRS